MLSAALITPAALPAAPGAATAATTAGSDASVFSAVLADANAASSGAPAPHSDGLDVAAAIAATEEESLPEEEVALNAQGTWSVMADMAAILAALQATPVVVDAALVPAQGTATSTDDGASAGVAETISSSPADDAATVLLSAANTPAPLNPFAALATPTAPFATEPEHSASPGPTPEPVDATGAVASGPGQALPPAALAAAMQPLAANGQVAGTGPALTAVQELSSTVASAAAERTSPSPAERRLHKTADSGQRVDDRPATLAHTAGQLAFVERAEQHERASRPMPMEPATSASPWLSSAPALSTSASISSSRPLAEPGFQAQLSAALNSHEFAPALGVQLSTLTRNGIPQALLHLNPAELGPINVQIELEGRRALVVLVAAHAETRQALEQAMPQLASAMLDAGFTMSGGGVFQQPQQRAAHPQSARARAAGQNADDDSDVAALTGPGSTRARVQQGVVDLYA